MLNQVAMRESISSPDQFRLLKDEDMVIAATTTIILLLLFVVFGGISILICVCISIFVLLLVFRNFLVVYLSLGSGDIPV